MVLTFAALDEVRAWGEAQGEGRLHDMMSRFDSASYEVIGRKMLLRDPYCQRWGGRKICRAADLIGEQRGLGASLMVLPPERVAGSYQLPTLSKRQSLVYLGSWMLAAQPYLWRDDLRIAAQQGDLPPHVIGRDLLPHPVMWWSWEAGAEVLGAVDGALEGFPPGAELMSDGVLIIDEGTGMSVVTMGAVQTAREEFLAFFINSGGIRYGRRFPQDIPAYARPATAALLGMFSFLASSYVEQEPQRPDRAARRAAKRENDEDESPEVMVVQLRHAVREAAKKAAAPDEVDWKCRWLVAGHHRAQWYPSTQSHKVIWIAPHVKGPEDMPLKPRVYDVVR